MSNDSTTPPPPVNTSAWTPERTAQLMTGMAATGGGLALLSILNDQIRSQRRKAEAEKGKVLEGTISISPPASSKFATMTEWMEGLGAGAGTYILLQKAYQTLRRKQLASEIEDADKEFGGAVQESVSSPAKKKVALEGPSLGELLYNAPKDTLWLSALAAGAGTYGLLEHTWPRVSESPEAGKPKRIVVKGYGTVMADGAGDGPLAQLDKERGAKIVKKELEAEDTPTNVSKMPVSRGWLGNAVSKAASISCPVGIDDNLCSACMMTFLLGEAPQLKLASSGLISLIAAHHKDASATETLVKEAGLLGAIELSKGEDASYYDLSPMQKRAAIHHAFKSATMRPSLTLLAVGEMEEVDPDFSKRARVAASDDVTAAMLTKSAALTWQAEILIAAGSGRLEKTAATASMAADMRRQMGTLGISESRDADGQMDDADAAYSDESDPIDEFLAGKKEQNPKK